MIANRAAKGGSISEKLLKYWTCVKLPNLEFYFMLFLLLSCALFLCLLLSSHFGEHWMYVMDLCLLAFQVSFFSCNHHILLCSACCCSVVLCRFVQSDWRPLPELVSSIIDFRFIVEHNSIFLCASHYRHLFIPTLDHLHQTRVATMRFVASFFFSLAPREAWGD